VSEKARTHSFLPNGHGVAVADTPPALREAPCLTDDEIRALAAIARRVEAHYGVPQDIEWALLDEPPTATSPAVPSTSPTPETLSTPSTSTAPADSAASAASVGERIVLLQSRPETVWASRTAPSVAAPKARAADHVLSLFGKPL